MRQGSCGARDREAVVHETGELLCMRQKRGSARDRGI
jgi:hypothetical protein